MADTVHVYALGLVACSVCAPNTLTAQQVEDAANTQNPTGISSRWTLSNDPVFHNGGPQPGPCDQQPSERTHYLLGC